MLPTLPLIHSIASRMASKNSLKKFNPLKLLNKLLDSHAKIDKQLQSWAKHIDSSIESINGNSNKLATSIDSLESSLSLTSKMASLKNTINEDSADSLEKKEPFNTQSFIVSLLMLATFFYGFYALNKRLDSIIDKIQSGSNTQASATLPSDSQPTPSPDEKPDKKSSKSKK